MISWMLAAAARPVLCLQWHHPRHGVQDPHTCCIRVASRHAQQARLLDARRTLDQSDARRTGSGRLDEPLQGLGGELEREFAFGVVRQLFESVLLENEDALLPGAASAARVVFDLSGDTDDNADPSFASMHGLYWLLVNLSMEGPLPLAIDDFHWCDRTSLRFLAYLVRRLHSPPVLVLATLRSARPSDEAALFDEIAGDELTVSIRPRPLSEESTGSLIRERLGGDVAADEYFRAPATEHRTRPRAEADAQIHLAIGGYVERWRAVPDAVEVASYNPRTDKQRQEYVTISAPFIERLEAEGLADLVPLVDTNLFGMSIDTRLSAADQRDLGRLIELGQPMAIFGRPAPGRRRPDRAVSTPTLAATP